MNEVSSKLLTIKKQDIDRKKTLKKSTSTVTVKKNLNNSNPSKEKKYKEPRKINTKEFKTNIGKTTKLKFARDTNQNSPKKFFNIEQRLKEAKKKQKQKFHRSQIQVDYQANTRPTMMERQAEDQFPDIELFFSSLEFYSSNPSHTHKNYFLVIKTEKSSYVTDVCKKFENWDFEQTLTIEYIFEKRQKIQVKALTEDGELLGKVEFELGQVIGNWDNSIVIDLKGGLIGYPEQKNLKNLEKKISNLSDIIQKKIPKIKIGYKLKEGSSSARLSQKMRKKFIDYLQNGLKISVITCVDFTASNNHTPDGVSLHQLHDDYLNEYQSAIASICSILVNYDDDKLIPIYGFGAEPLFQNFEHLQPEERRLVKNLGLESMVSSHSNVKINSFKKCIKRKGTFKNSKDVISFKTGERYYRKISEEKKNVSHFFPLSGNWDENAGHDIEGVFEIYTQVIKQNLVRMSSPTLFSPMLKEVNGFAREARKTISNYYVLLIITDGVLHDMDETIEQVIQGTCLPLSVIIVGVGNEDFEYMKILDADHFALKDKHGNIAMRDIIQFVDYSYYNEKDIDFGGLAEDVLKEIPRQVYNYYEMIGKEPWELTVKDSELLGVKEGFSDSKESKNDCILSLPGKKESKIKTLLKFKTGASKISKGSYLGRNELRNFEFVSSVRNMEISRRNYEDLLCKKVVVNLDEEGESDSMRKIDRKNVNFKWSKSNQSSDSAWKYKTPEDEGIFDAEDGGGISKMKNFKVGKMISHLNEIYSFNN